MQEQLVSALRSQRPQIRMRWEALLRNEPVLSPLGHPDSLVHLLEWSLDEMYVALANPLAGHHHRRHRGGVDGHVECPCGRNPLLAYFAAGEKAVREGWQLSQSFTPHVDPAERGSAAEEMLAVYHQIARREIEAFCGVCQFRPLEAVAAHRIPE